MPLRLANLNCFEELPHYSYVLISRAPTSMLHTLKEDVGLQIGSSQPRPQFISQLGLQAHVLYPILCRGEQDRSPKARCTAQKDGVYWSHPRVCPGGIGGRWRLSELYRAGSGNVEKGHA
jgi:hypothetical protein